MQPIAPEDLCDHDDCNGNTVGVFYDRPQSETDLVRCDKHLPEEVIKAREWLKSNGAEYDSSFDAAHGCAYDTEIVKPDMVDLSIPGWLVEAAEELFGKDEVSDS